MDAELPNRRSVSVVGCAQADFPEFCDGWKVDVGSDAVILPTVRYLILTTSLCIALVQSAAFAQAKHPADASLGFGTAAPSHAELTDPRTGKQYKVELEVDPDVNGRAGIVNLVLLRPGSDEDLLLPFGFYHGLQPYGFAALDLLGGPDKSAFGRIRAIPIRRTATKLIVRVDEAQTRPVAAGVVSDAADAEVTKLQVHVSLRTEP